MSRWILFAIIFFSFAGQVKGASELPHEVVAKEITRGGNLHACSIEFRAIVRDYPYRSGDLVGVTGSINLFLSGPGKLSTSFKLVANDVMTDGSLQRFKIAEAGVSDPKSIGSGSAIACEDDRHYCAAMDGDAWISILGVLAASKNVVLRYNRSPGGLDVKFHLAMESHSVMTLLGCAQRLATQ